MGATMVRYWNEKIRFHCFFFPFIPTRIFKRTFQVPVWAILPLWFGTVLSCTILALSAGLTGSLTYWAHGGGFLWGAAITAAALRWQMEERFLRSAIAKQNAATSNSVIEKALAAHSNGDIQQAYDLLAHAAEEAPDDPKTIITFWEVACALKRTMEVAPAMLRIASAALRRGDKEMATQYWNAIAERAPEAPVNSTWLVRLVPVLLELDQSEQAARALRRAVSEEQSISLETLLDVLKLASGLDAQTGVRAANRALASPDLDESKREHVQKLLSKFAAEVALRPNRSQATGPDRSIAIEEEADEFAMLTARDLGLAPSASDLLSRELDVTGMLVESANSPTDDDADQYLGIPPSDLMQHSVVRFLSVKAMDAAPVELLDESIVLARRGGKPTKLDYREIDAIAVAAISGTPSKPILVVDLILNWSDSKEEILRTVRLRSDGFDVRRLVPIAHRPTDAFRTLIAELLSRSAATPLPDENSARGHPFRTFADLETYHREVLEAQT
jgi:tetratricopeptide (TPR) repeat protein